jgi:hypothetical protein
MSAPGGDGARDGDVPRAEAVLSLKGVRTRGEGTCGPPAAADGTRGKSAAVPRGRGMPPSLPALCAAANVARPLRRRQAARVSTSR